MPNKFEFFGDQESRRDQNSLIAKQKLDTGGPGLQWEL